MASIKNRVARLEQQRIARYDAIIARVFSQLSDDELSEYAGAIMQNLSDDELEAIAAGGDPPSDYVEQPLPTWWWQRVRGILTVRECKILGWMASNVR